MLIAAWTFHWLHTCRRSRLLLVTLATWSCFAVIFLLWRDYFVCNTSTWCHADSVICSKCPLTLINNTKAGFGWKTSPLMHFKTQLGWVSPKWKHWIWFQDFEKYPIQIWENEDTKICHSDICAIQINWMGWGHSEYKDSSTLQNREYYMLTIKGLKWPLLTVDSIINGRRMALCSRLNDEVIAEISWYYCKYT